MSKSKWRKRSNRVASNMSNLDMTTSINPASGVAAPSASRFEKNMQILTQVFSLFSLLLVLFTLFEMQTQRDQAYKPALVMKHVDIDMKWEDKYDLLDLSFSDQTKRDNSTYIQVRNIGEGAAKNVSFVWDRGSFDDLISIVNESDHYHADGANGILTITSDDTVWGGIHMNGSEYVDYLTSDDEAGYMLKLPDVYVYLCKIALMGQTHADMTVRVKVEYQDIQGKSYSEFHEFRIDVGDVFSTSGESYTDFRGQGSVRINPIPNAR